MGICLSEYGSSWLPQIGILLIVVAASTHDAGIPGRPSSNTCTIVDADDNRFLDRIGLLQILFHPIPTSARRGFRGASTSPVGLQVYRVGVAGLRKRAELCRPIDIANVDR